MESSTQLSRLTEMTNDVESSTTQLLLVVHNWRRQMPPRNRPTTTRRRRCVMRMRGNRRPERERRSALLHLTMRRSTPRLSLQTLHFTALASLRIFPLSLVHATAAAVVGRPRRLGRSSRVSRRSSSACWCRASGRGAFPHLGRAHARFDFDCLDIWFPRSCNVE